jgi:hypothetical protein
MKVPEVQWPWALSLVYEVALNTITGRCSANAVLMSYCEALWLNTYFSTKAPWPS